MEIITIITKFLASDLWRTTCIALVIICFALIAVIRIKSITQATTQNALDKANNTISAIQALSKVQEVKIELAMSELSKLRQKQKDDAVKLKQMLEDFPQDCDGAAKRALTILRRAQ